MLRFACLDWPVLWCLSAKIHRMLVNAQKAEARGMMEITLRLYEEFEVEGDLEVLDELLAVSE